jgi:PrsW family intramembrane metalloprotease
MQFAVAIGLIAVAVVLVRVWSGVMNFRSVESESLASIERKHPYLPTIGTIVIGAVITGALLLFSFKSSGASVLQDVFGSAATKRTIIVFLVVIGFGVFEQWRWKGDKDRYKYFFAFVLGTVVSWILIGFKRALFETAAQQDPFIMALGLVCVVLGWKFLFGPWNANVKATVLGTFIFWTSYAILRHETSEELLATAIAAVMALIPAVIWCKMFLSYHKQRFSVVLLAFFAGMLSTVPILFYAQLMQRGVELNFFVFKVVPISFGGAAQEFVTGTVLPGGAVVQTTVLVTLFTYLTVGVIEELSKFWVLRHSSDQFFRSIDDVLQLSIVVAIGFAFAENLANPSYFVGFVRNYLLVPGGPFWPEFLSNVIGRSILTIMVHILSTGVLGYYFGVAFFASPMMREQFMHGKGHAVMQWLHRVLQLNADMIYARYRLAQGLLFSIILHGAFDFIVSLPEVLPGNPRTVGALLGQSQGSFLNSISITMPPAILYVVGGCWLLIWLFARKDDMKEYGAVVQSQTFVN